MIKLSNEKIIKIDPVVKKMSDMEPLEVCVIFDKKHNSESKTIVMRTASTENFEVINLSLPGANKCWTSTIGLKVRELFPGETYTLELS